MEFNFAERDIFFWVIGLIILGFYFHVFVGFFQNNYWIVFCFVYIAYFVLNDGYQRLKKIEDNLKIVEIKDIRINFWN